MTFNFKSIKKPKYKIVVKEAEKYLWPQFHDHHYMTANESIIDSLPRSSKFFTFYWVRDNKEVLIGCLGVLNQISKKPARRITRLVVLPEFQGLGFSKIMLENISEMYLKENITMYITTFHPGLGDYFNKNSCWAESNNNMKEFKTNSIEDNPLKNSLRDGIAMYRYHYVGNSDYSLEYNPLIMSDMQNKIKCIDDENDKEYKRLKREISKMERKKDPTYKEPTPDELRTDDPEHIKAKAEHKKLFKTKRKVLSASERKALRDKKKQEKEDFDEF